MMSKDDLRSELNDESISDVKDDSRAGSTFHALSSNERLDTTQGGVDILGWDGPDDQKNPENWSSTKKWTVMIFATFLMFCVELNATAPASASSLLASRFSLSDYPFPNSYWPITSWTLSGALFPPLLTPLIEDHGTRPGLLLLFTLFTIFIIPQALAHNFATLVVTRVVAGGCGATIAAVVDGIAADLWQGERERGRGVVIYTFGLVGGYTVGPVMGGAVISQLSWRWSFWIQLILYGILLLPLVFLFPETRSQVISSKLSKSSSNSEKQETTTTKATTITPSPKKLLQEALLRPTQLLFTEPVLASFTLWSSFTLGMIFMFTQSIPQVYSALYDFSPSESGIVQIAIFIGQTIALPICWCWNDYTTSPSPSRATSSSSSATSSSSAISEEEEEADHPNKINNNNNKNNKSGKGRNKKKQTPETKLILSIPTTLLCLSGGFFLYAWTSSPNLHYIIPTLGLLLVGFATMTIVTAVDTYITDSYALYAGSAIAAITFGENLISGTVPLATGVMYTNLGFGWASSVLGFIGLGMVAAPVVLVWKGEGIRSRSRFMNAGQDDRSKSIEDDDDGGGGGGCV